MTGRWKCGSELEVNELEDGNPNMKAIIDKTKFL